MTAYSEELDEVSFGEGLYTADLPSALPDGFCSRCENMVPTGTSLENRYGFKKTTISFDPTIPISDTFPPSPGLSVMGPQGVDDAPILIWGEKRSDWAGSPTISYHIHFVREGDRYTFPQATGTPGDSINDSPIYSGSTADAYFEISSAARFMGACQYLDYIYLFLSNGSIVRAEIDQINWSTGSLGTTTTLTGTGSNWSAQPVSYMDRLWCADGYKLRFTDAPTAPGNYPETWDTAENFFVMHGKGGPCNIQKIVPLNTRMLVFTSNGLFSLSVQGPPSAWYLRPIDASARCNTYECAFEHNGLVYYVTDTGVYVTDGSSSISLAGAISNYFLSGNFDAGGGNLAGRSNLYRINYLDGGMVVSIANYIVTDDGSSVEPQYDVDNCKTFYSRLDNIAWSDWNFGSSAGEHKIGSVIAIADSLTTYLNSTPMSFILMEHTRSTDITRRRIVRELFVYDGLTDEWTLANNESSLETSADVKCGISSRYFTGDRLTELKHLKYAYIELFFSDYLTYVNTADRGVWSYSWLTDVVSITPEANLIENSDTPDILSLEYGLQRLQAGFQYRQAQFIFDFDTEGLTSFKLKNLYLPQHETRDSPQAVS